MATNAVWQGFADDGTDASSYTFTAAPIGTAAEDRQVIVGVISRGSAVDAVISSITVGGVAATLLASVATNRALYAFYSALVPTGTTGDIVVTYTATQFRCGVDIWSVTGWDGVLYDSTNDTTAPANIFGDATDISCPAGGSILGIAGNQVTTPSWTWSGLTERSDRAPESGPRYSGASDNFASAQTDIVITATKAASSSTACALQLIALGPPESVDAVLAVSEDPDTIAAATSLALEAAFAATEAVDTLSAAASAELQTVLAATEAADTLSATAELSLAAVFTKTEAADTVLASALVSAGGDFAYGLVSFAGLDVQEEIEAAVLLTEAADTLSAESFFTAELVLAIVEDADTVVSAATLPIELAGINSIEANDALIAILAVTIEAVASLTEQPDTAASVTTLPIELTVAVAEQGDVLDAPITIGQLASFVLVATEESDTIVAAADIDIATQQIAVAITEQPDTAVIALQIQQAASLTFAATEQADTFVATLQITILALQAVLTATEANDSLSSAALHLVDHLQAVLDVAEESDTFDATILIEQDAIAELDVTEEDDSTLSAILVEQAALLELDVLEADDTGTGAGEIEQFALADAAITEEDDLVLGEALIEQGAQLVLVATEEDDLALSFVGKARLTSASGSLRAAPTFRRPSNVQSPYLRRSA